MTSNPNLIDSKPAWPPTIAPPEGAPNVLLVLIDDAGFGSNSTFGGVVPTPNLDKLANEGLRYTQMQYRITAEFEVPQGGANGVLVTQGRRFSGWGLYLKDGKPTFTMNLLDIERPKWQSPDALQPGKHSIVFD